ncbi:endogenous retrovirus group S71 member 1 Env polyprotein-like [Saccopteryx leptura]|uniref:endogenous retrovirus group S71 member 1 Env polyprotein-like n=1 Tax=Saccopteryx leptura TaxID=249018 RepID=UPI00339BF1F0
MVSVTGPRSASQGHLLQGIRTLIFYWTVSYGLEFQEWVLMRSDGTVIASNYTQGGTSSIIFRADLSKFFGSKLCYSDGLHSPHSNKASTLKGVAGEVGSNCNNNENLNRDLFHTDLYACPESKNQKRKNCGGVIADYYCRNWGCETIVSPQSWAPKGGCDVHINIKRDKSERPKNQNNPECKNDNCNPTVLTVLNPQDPAWIRGHTWGMRLYTSGWNPGTFFTIKQIPTSAPSMIEGEKGGLPLESRGHEPIGNDTIHDPKPIVDRPHQLGAEALELLDKIFPYFNNTQPEITESCWLCLSPRPPFYLGVGANTTQDSPNAPIQNPLTGTSSEKGQEVDECLTDSSLTLARFHGKGTCYLLANFNLESSNYSKYCLGQEKLALPTNQKDLTIMKAADGLWFVCLQGIYKCIIPTSPTLCISAYIIPQVYLYEGNPNLLVAPTSRVGRAPLLVPIIATLGVIGSTAVGAGAYAYSENSLKRLSQTFSKDLSILQNQVIYLEHQVDSLAEVALQNRRGLDLLFLQQGGLCAALGEECCFYANHSGVIRENIRTLTKRLRDREKEEDNTSWYASWFQTSPWLTTLISAIAGPLLVLLLVLTIGPIILNKVLGFIKERIEVVKLMVLSQPYTLLAGEENESKV